MGFFDSIKSAANFITGGGATVNVATAEQMNNGNEPIPVQIQVVVKDSDIDVRNIYLKVRAVEYIETVQQEVEIEADGDVEVENEHVTLSHETYNTELIVDGAQTLEANETYTFETEISLPHSVPGSYYGHAAKHEWSIYAGLDIAGNDPDSNWVSIHVVK